MNRPASPSSRRQALSFVLLLLVAGSIAYLIKDFVAANLLPPLLTLLRIIGILLSFLPQAFYWIILLLIVSFLAARSLWLDTADRVREETFGQGKRGPIQTWSRWLSGRHRGRYFNHLVAERLTNLALEILASEEQLTFEQAREEIKNGRLDLPPEIQAYFQAGLNKFDYVRERIPPRISRLPWRRKQSPSPLDIPLEDVVRYLEERLSEERE